MIPTETLCDWNCIDEKTQQPQSFSPLVECNLHDFTLTLLSWVRGHNLNNPRNRQALTYGQEAGDGYFAFELKLHGDMVAKRTQASSTYHLAKVICFDDDRTKVRIRYLVWRTVRGPHGRAHPIARELLDMLEVDYSLNAHPRMNNVKKAAVDVYNHISDGTFDFTLYREHLAHEPRIHGKQGFKQSVAKRLIHPDSHQTA
jgi:hypothetical protein